VVLFAKLFLTMASLNEKSYTNHINQAENNQDVSFSKEVAASGELITLDNGVSVDEAITELPPKEQRRILRKVDIRVVPLLTFLYLIAYIDRNNSMPAFSYSSVRYWC
jgi:hypothetical protein